MAGLAGNPLQAFGPALAEKGFVVLAPDSICFEDRHLNKTGVEPDTDETDWLQHFNQMSYRLVQGETLMRKILEDASVGISLLAHLPFVSAKCVGVLGHSYGGNTALFQAATYERIQFVCASGALCSYQHKMKVGAGLKMALTIPGIYPQFDFDEILRCVAPRKTLIVSADQDKYSQDADLIVAKLKAAFETKSGISNLSHFRESGGHPVTRKRFDFILDWLNEVSCKCPI